MYYFNHPVVTNCGIPFKVPTQREEAQTLSSFTGSIYLHPSNILNVIRHYNFGNNSYQCIRIIPQHPTPLPLPRPTFFLERCLFSQLLLPTVALLTQSNFGQETVLLWLGRYLRFDNHPRVTTVICTFCCFHDMQLQFVSLDKRINSLNNQWPLNWVIIMTS